jgi:hypothetical protein
MRSALIELERMEKQAKRAKVKQKERLKLETRGRKPRMRGKSWRKETAFNGSRQKIVKTFMPEQYNKIPPARIWSFLDVIISEKEKAILATWTKHLEHVKVPYRITEQIIKNYRERNECKVLILWTERKA